MFCWLVWVLRCLHCLACPPPPTNLELQFHPVPGHTLPTRDKPQAPERRVSGVPTEVAQERQHGIEP